MNLDLRLGGMSPRDSLLAAVVAVIWGLNFVVIDWGMHDVPPLFQQAGRTLLGSAFRLEGRDKLLGGAFMYESKGAQDLRPRIGEEPSRSVIGDLNTDWTFRPNWVTRMVDNLPGVRTTAPSEFRVQAEVGASFPNPNTRNEVFGPTRNPWNPALTCGGSTGGGAVAQSAFWSLIGLSAFATPWVWRRVLALDRGGLATTIILGTNAIGAALPIFGQSIWLLALSALVFGVAFFAVVGSTTAFVRFNYPPQAWPVAIAAMTISFGIGQTLGPIVVGAITDAVGSLSFALNISAAMLALGAVLSAFQKKVVRAP